MEEMKFPYFASGVVVKGFGRGSKELGIPTANFDNEVVEQLPEYFQQGVYYGWAQVDNGPVYKMVMSIGNNPYYNNEKKTMVRFNYMRKTQFVKILLNKASFKKETYIMNEFPEDFYGSNLKIAMLGYIRPMTSFKSLGELLL